MQDMDTQERERYRQRIRNKKRRRIISLSVMVVIVILLIIGIVRLIGWITTPKYIESADIGPLPPAEGDPIVITLPPKYYDYSAPVPLADEVGDGYFSSTLMIGDARVMGLTMFGHITTADVFGSEGTSVDSLRNDTFTVGEAERTLTEQLMTKPYEAIYIEIGLNELGWPNTAAFMESYAALVDTVKNNAPTAAIYLQGIIPVTASKSGNPSHLTNEKIAEINREIMRLAQDKKVYYLDIAEGMSNGTGVLLSGYAASNGLSLSSEGYAKWVEYIKTHVVDKEIYS
ncbi:MAG: GDSL-type esterase/lipase family protein [Oscillospiraceae bacterium]|nr:GDSL-type esterase/lipase family protein [Oscillospiraceae bacterium]